MTDKVVNINTSFCSLSKSAPVQPDAEDPKVLETSDKELLVCSPVAELFTGSVKYWHLTHSASVPNNKKLLTLS